MGNKLPSQFQIGDYVYLNLSSTFKQAKDIKKAEDFTAKVIAVHFTISKVRYDLELKFAGEEEESTRIYNIDSCFVWQVHPSECDL